MNKVRVDRGGRWVDTNCSLYPADNIWHTRVDGLPTRLPNTPTGGTMASFPQEPTADWPDPLKMTSSVRPKAYGRPVNYTSHADDVAWVQLTDRWNSRSEFTAVRYTEFLGIPVATQGLIAQHMPANPARELSSNDDHTYFVDTDLCTLYEYIGWSRVQANTARAVSVFDLETNYRRMSSAAGWAGPERNGPDHATQPLDSPYDAVEPTVNGMDGFDMRGAREAATASGGSGMNAIPGIIRLDEVFATPDIDDQTVDATRRIDHAISAVVPAWNITATPTTLGPGAAVPFVWPAVKSDGCGGGGTCAGDAGGVPSSAFHIPMGSRLRLGAERCAATYEEPQARMVIAALCTYGIIVTDSSTHFAIRAEQSYAPADATHPTARSKWRSAAGNELDQLTLRDFELVDSSSMAAVDQDLLWSSAVNWAVAKYGAGTPLHGGWYEGSYWSALLKCPRPSYTVGATVRPDCADPGLAAVDRTVNSPQWLTGR